MKRNIQDKTKKIFCLGIMSGTSLDGIDIAYCSFEEDDFSTFNILKTQTVTYSKSWRDKLINAEYLTGLELFKLNNEYGRYLGKCINDFIFVHKIKPLFISSHGHTVFHQPDTQLTVQIGSGAVIAAICCMPVVSDFRSIDVALGGQGAPLVPIGDQNLFPNYSCCLNIGGIANISFLTNKKRIAFDITFANMALNYLAQKADKEIDNNGKLARSGNINPQLLQELNNFQYFQLLSPKSLGKEDFINWYLPSLERSAISIPDKLATCCEHIAQNIASITKKNHLKSMLMTGGGVLNKYLSERIINCCTQTTVTIPHKNIINFKEALVFAYLGVLRWNEQPNCLSSVTGATKNNIGGNIYFMN